MIHLDTNFLILAMVAGSAPEGRLRQWLAANEPVGISAIVWAEFLCGPVDPAHAAMASTLFPSPEPFMPADGPTAASLFNTSGRRRGTMLDCMIAATALRVGAAVATNNADDFRRFVPSGLRVI